MRMELLKAAAAASKASGECPCQQLRPPRRRGGPLRVGASLTTKLALELPYPVADEANCRQGGGVGIGSPDSSRLIGATEANGRRLLARETETGASR